MAWQVKVVGGGGGGGDGCGGGDGWTTDSSVPISSLSHEAMLGEEYLVDRVLLVLFVLITTVWRNIQRIFPFHQTKTDLRDITKNF
jgi:hypothetical protein